MEQSTSVQVNLAKVEQMLIGISKDMDEAKVSRKETYGKIETINHNIGMIEHRLQTLEEKFNEASPTLKEFIAVKHRVQGAGVLGKVLWMIGGALIGGLTVVIGFFSKGG